MACEKIRKIKAKELTEREKLYKMLHNQIDYIIKDAAIQPNVAWKVIFNAGIALTTVATIIKDTYNIDV